VLEQVLLFQLQLCGGVTSSVFPLVEVWLREDSDRQKIARELNVEVCIEYRSVIDMLFCETFREFQTPCVSYYEVRGKQFRKLLSEEKLAIYERALLYACMMAYEKFKADRLLRWSAIAGATRMCFEEELLAA
jgi:hypothetical protein